MTVLWVSQTLCHPRTQDTLLIDFPKYENYTNLKSNDSCLLLFSPGSGGIGSGIGGGPGGGGGGGGVLVDGNGPSGGGEEHGDGYGAGGGGYYANENNAIGYDGVIILDLV